MAISTDNRNARSSLIVTEHDPFLREDATGMMNLVSQSMGGAYKDAAVLLCSSGTDTVPVDLTINAWRVFYLDEGQELRLTGRALAVSFS